MQEVLVSPANVMLGYWRERTHSSNTMLPLLIYIARNIDCIIQKRKLTKKNREEIRFTSIMNSLDRDLRFFKVVIQEERLLLLMKK